MLWGQDDTQKFRYAIRLAAALSAIALYSRDRLMVARIRSSEVEEIHGPLLSELGLLPLLRNLRQVGISTECANSFVEDIMLSCCIF
jgi:hypothetical protein